MNALKKLFEKKKGKALDPEYKRAKMGMLESLSEEMGGMMANDLKGLKKVTVASADKKGLKEGLEKAEDLIDGEEEVEESEGTEEVEAEESSDEDMSLEDLEDKIKELEALKLKRMME